MAPDMELEVSTPTKESAVFPGMLSERGFRVQGSGFIQGLGFRV